MFDKVFTNVSFNAAMQWLSGTEAQDDVVRNTLFPSFCLIVLQNHFGFVLNMLGRVVL